MSKATLYNDQKEAAEALVKWFDNRELPSGEVQLSPSARLLNARKFVERNTTNLLHAKPFTVDFVACYTRLNELKNYLLKNARI